MRTPYTDKREKELKGLLLNQSYDSEEVNFVVGLDAGLAVARELEERLIALKNALEFYVSAAEDEVSYGGMVPACPEMGRRLLNEEKTMGENNPKR